MKITLLHKILGLSFFAKAITYKNGSLLLFSIPFSFGFTSGFKRIFKNANASDLELPILSIVCCIVLYLIFWAFDFISGLIASKYESKSNPDWVESDKLYLSFGKIGGVILVDALLVFITSFLIALGYVRVSSGVLLIGVLLNILAMSYELHSIGENIKRRSGTKPKFLSFFDKIISLLEKGIIKKIAGKLDVEESDQKSINDIEVDVEYVDPKNLEK
jgi:hypothetical protein